MQSSSPAPQAQTWTDRRKPLERCWSKVPLEGKVRQRAKKSSKELARIRRVSIGILPHVKITDDCDSTTRHKHFVEHLLGCVASSSNTYSIRDSVQLQTVVAMYHLEIDRDRAIPSDQRSKTMVRRRFDQMITTRNFRARTERIETGVWVKSQKREECQR